LCDTPVRSKPIASFTSPRTSSRGRGDKAG
jgi:hypothetical protein